MSRWAYNMARETVRGIESMRRAREADERRVWREHVRAQREAQKQAIREYQGARQSEAEFRTREAEERVEEIRSILRSSSLASSRDWRSLVLLDGLVMPPFVPPASLAVHVRAPQERDFVGSVRTLPAPLLWLPFLRRRHEARLADARKQFAQATVTHARAKANRQAELQTLRSRHETEVRALRDKIDAFHQRVEATRARALDGDPLALAEVVSLALSPDTWVFAYESFPLCHISIDIVNREVVVDVEVPDPLDVVPDRARFKYVKKSDEIREIPTSERATHSAYRDFLAGVLVVVARATLVVSEGTAIQTVTCNAWRGFAGDGHCSASLRANAEQWKGLDLSAVDAWDFFREHRGRMAAKPAGESTAAPFNKPTDRFESPEDDLLAERDAIRLAFQGLLTSHPGSTATSRVVATSTGA